MSEFVLVINVGSTSVKADLINPTSGKCDGKLRIERLGSDQAVYSVNNENRGPAPSSHDEAIRTRLPELLEGKRASLVAVGHRIVHGGKIYSDPVVIDQEVMKQLEMLSPMAPLHNPVALMAVRAAVLLITEVPHIAVFDTGFHTTIPDAARAYALPTRLVQEYDLRKYGFHGTSHDFAAKQIAAYLRTDLQKLKLITCHLGGGCSVCAIDGGRSVETSMGMTPLEGLIMSTRCGDLDPTVLLRLQQNAGYGTRDLEYLLTQQSGLLALTNGRSDFRDIERGAKNGLQDCLYAIDVFCHRLIKYIGSYLAVLGGADAIVFTAGIGENSAWVRRQICDRLICFGVHLDDDENYSVGVTEDIPVVEITDSNSRLRAFVSRSNEALSIARSTHELLLT
ncbi:acetate/propionate family kinase [bacterium]|nr:acetate/propionate family kinase [bacterium]